MQGSVRMESSLVLLENVPADVVNQKIIFFVQ